MIVSLQTVADARLALAIVLQRVDSALRVRGQHSAEAGQLSTR